MSYALLLSIIDANMYTVIYLDWHYRPWVQYCGLHIDGGAKLQLCLEYVYHCIGAHHRHWDRYSLGRHDTMYIYAQSPLISDFILRRVHTWQGYLWINTQCKHTTQS